MLFTGCTNRIKCIDTLGKQAITKKVPSIESNRPSLNTLINGVYRTQLIGAMTLIGQVDINHDFALLLLGLRASTSYLEKRHRSGASDISHKQRAAPARDARINSNVAHHLPPISQEPTGHRVSRCEPSQ